MVRLEGSARTTQQAVIAEEVPVAFVYNQRPHVVMMCSPADFEDLAIGFTVTEEIAAAGEVSRIEVARHRRGVELSIEIPAAAGARLAARARAISGRTGCGLCGVEAIDDAIRATHPVHSAMQITPAALWKAGAALDARQPLNRETNAIHAAAWATSDGALEMVREDVGRHNALDKTLGALLRAGVDPATGFLLLTSRASFELIQKAAVCGVPLVAAVSRPTGLAIRMASDAGITLVGLLRGESANVYTHASRIAQPS
ncbi:MAG: formate dehydrogenase accessory sulfurtransferase FdhD [Gemmatimonadaceae bacterium]|nr:formate dehydrogenase accessory sulfurtransferase FdhD [Gemmatimonadaceae bacterium]